MEAGPRVQPIAWTADGYFNLGSIRSHVNAGGTPLIRGSALIRVHPFDSIPFHMGDIPTSIFAGFTLGDSGAVHDNERQ